MIAASFAPLIVMFTTCAVPSIVLTVKLSGRVWPLTRTCTAELALFSV